MEPSNCYLGIGLILGAAFAALLATGEVKRRAAEAKIKGYDVQKQKAEAMMEKAKEKRKEGFRERPLAYFLFALALLLAAFACYISRVQPF